jgi:two-component system CitB family response regulator
MSDCRVFIVEDDLRISEINRRFTEKVEGYEVCGIATNLDEAKEMLEILEPDLVLLDIYFPDGHGIDFLWHIRNHHRATDVIMITAAKEINAVQEALRGGAIDYIIKPVVFDRFQNTLRKYQEYRNRVQDIRSVDQQKVDHIFHAVRREVSVEKVIPKGIDPLTLQKIEEFIEREHIKGITAEELGKHVGVSRTTARRYLEYMVSNGTIRAELAYGTVGRPERRYFFIE